tara:strand:- start:621 stop:788 length:168 start_codon:yes stop_codon:yes gene_type:complete
MKVYTPSKSTPTLQNVLKELYCLKQAIKHDLGNPDDHLKTLDNISAKVREVLDGE